MALTADDVETIKSLIVDPLSKQIDSVQNQILSIHTPLTCPEVANIKKDVSKVVKQVNIWTGGLAILAGIGWLLVALKNEIIGIFRG